jgi:hypothetical protein
MHVESFTVHGWKRYECAGCGCVYRCRFERRAGGGGDTPEQAHENAMKEAISPFENDWDRHPCPECGRLQPRYVGTMQDESQFMMFVVALCVIAPVATLAWLALNSSLAAVAVAVAALILCLCYWLVAKRDPNADLDANKERAANLLSRGKMTVLRSGDPRNVEPPPPVVTSAHTTLILSAAAAAGVGLLIGIGGAIAGGLPEALGWVAMGIAGIPVVAIGWWLAKLSETTRQEWPPALVERLDGKDGEVVLLSDVPKGRGRAPKQEKPLSLD